MLCLGANEGILTRYWPLKNEDLRMIAAVTIPNAWNHRTAGITWFWSMDIQCYDQYFLLNGLSTFSPVHLILSWHVIILSQGMLSFIYFLMISTISLMLSQPSFNFRAVHGYVFFSSLPFWCLTHHTCSCFHSMHSLLNFCTHSPGLRVFLMHLVSVDLIQLCTSTMSSI